MTPCGSNTRLPVPGSAAAYPIDHPGKGCVVQKRKLGDLTPAASQLL